MHTAFGYKDNVLLSGVNRESSVFFNGGLDLSVIRLPIDGPQVQLLFSGEDTRYFNSTSVNKEQFLIGFAQVTHEFAPHWRGSIDFSHSYQDQIFDASISETNLTTVQARGQLFRTRPSVRRFLPSGLWLDAELTLARQYLQAPLDDDWQGGTKLTLGRSYGNKSEVSLHWQLMRLSFDDREQFTASGRSIPGATLEFHQSTIESSLNHNWDTDRRWRTLTRFGYLASTDNGPGYFDYEKLYAAQQLRYVAKTWQIRLQAKFAHYRYPIQTVSSTNLRLRSRDDLLIDLRMEKSLKEWAKLYAEFEHQRVLSNRAFERYHVNTVSAGVEFEF